MDNHLVRLLLYHRGQPLIGSTYLLQLDAGNPYPCSDPAENTSIH
jgi:hypothetical protein